jgi:hypothetical protein
MDDASGSVTATPVITVDHCTLYNVGNGNANYRLLYVRFAGNTINWTNNIVSGFVNKRGFSEQKNTAVPTFSNNCYYNTKNLVKAGDNAEQKDGAVTIRFYDENGTAQSKTCAYDVSKILKYKYTLKAGTYYFYDPSYAVQVYGIQIWYTK